MTDTKPRQSSEPANAWLYRYWQQRTWASEEQAREMIRRRIAEDNERFPFGSPNDPALADTLVFVRAAKGQVRLRRVPKPKSAPATVTRLGDAECPKGADVPRADFDSTDLQDDGTPQSILSEFGRGTGILYQAWVYPSDLPVPRGAGIRDGYPEFDADYDYSELQHRGAPPPLKVRIGPRGKITLMDGNHRLAFWRERGHDLVPVWVIDERPQMITLFSPGEEGVHFSAASLALHRAQQALNAVETATKHTSAQPA